MMAGAGEDVYCTLLMSDSYLPGALVLAHSLKDSGTKKKLAVLITADSLLQSTITELKSLYDYVIPVEKLSNPSLENLHRLDRLDLRFAFTKIALWQQIQFRKICYLDADVVALRAPDELFDLKSSFAAVPDVGWPDCFNSGMMVLKPSMSEYWSLHTLATSGTSFDGADQGLLNEHFGSNNWERLSFTYNCTPSSGYQYEPAHRHFRSSIKIVHFIGRDKPWQQGRNALSSAGSGVYKEVLGRWWSVYDRHYKLSQTSALGQISYDKQVVQFYVKDEQSRKAFEWAASGIRPAVVNSNAVLPQVQQETQRTQEQNHQQTLLTTVNTTMSSAETPLTEPPKTEHLASTQSDTVLAQRDSSPLRTEWDATRSEPPANAKPEAQDLPTTRYEMSKDPGLFRPPSNYPDVPKEFYFQPPPRPAQLEIRPSVFPWEQSAPTPTRVFADDPVSDQKSSDTVLTEVTDSSQQRPPPMGSVASPTRHFGHQLPTVPPQNFGSSDLWNSFSRSNAWDEVGSIEQYVRALKDSQSRKASVQVLYESPSTPSTSEVKDFAPTPNDPTTKRRKESLILTDFPTSIERPSLPVTPAPIRRSTFWGRPSEPPATRDEGEDLPAAQGVPEQDEWDPHMKLEQLRRASIATATKATPLSPPKPAPLRAVPVSSAQLCSRPSNRSYPNPSNYTTFSTQFVDPFSSSDSSQSGHASSGPSSARPDSSSNKEPKSILKNKNEARPLDEYSIA